MPAKVKVQQIYEKTGTLYLRDGVLVAFFLPKPLHDSAKAVLEVFEQYLAGLPKGALRWSGIGAGTEEWKPVDAKSFDKCRAMLDPAAAKKRPMTTFELVGAKEGNDAPEYAFTLISAKPDKEVPDEVNLVEMIYPSDVVEAANADKFVESVKGMASKLPYLSGYASPALIYSETAAGRAMMESRALALRHPGLDVHQNKTGCMEIGGRLRGARWLTFVGPDALKKLKGAKAVQDALPKGVSAEAVGAGLMIRAGKTPEIGDTNKKEGTPLLRGVAKVLEPVTQFKEDVLLKSYFADGDEDLLTKWERRLLD